MKKKEKPVRIVLFLRSLEIGGAQTHAAMLAEYLDRAGPYAVQVWTFSARGLIAEALRAKGITIVDVPEIPNDIVGKVVALTRLIQRLRRAKPAILLPFCDYPNKLLGAIWEFTGAEACVWNQLDEGREVTGKFLEKRSLNRTSAFVANAVEGKSFLMRRFKVPAEKIRIIHNGVRLEEPELDRSGWRRKLRIPEQASLAVMVANFTSFKDQPTLLKAWRIVQERRWPRQRPILLLVGNVRQTEGELRALAGRLGLAGTVLFSGQVKDLSGLLRASDLGVFSSKREGMPYAVLSCMLARLPVVASDITGIREALGPEYPYLVPPDDPAQFAEKIMEWIDHPDAGKKWIEANHERASSLFSPEIMGKNYEELFSELLGKRPHT